MNQTHTKTRQFHKDSYYRLLSGLEKMLVASDTVAHARGGDPDRQKDNHRGGRLQTDLFNRFSIFISTWWMASKSAA